MLHLLFIHTRNLMGLFNFTFAPNLNTTSSTDSSSTPTPQVIQLQLNEETVTVPMAEAEGKTIEQLFSDYGDELGDTARISRFVAAGRIVDGNSSPEAGVIYRGSISSEAKG